MKTKTLLLITAFAFLCTPSAQGGMLDGLAEAKSGQTKRISSFDQSGGNNDRINIEPGETATMAEIEGAGIIKHIWITINHPDNNYRRMMVLRMYWDGEDEPSVEAPIGDFFGQGWGEHYKFISLPLAAAPGGSRAHNCYFPMPFAEGAKITVENQSEKPCRAFYFYVDYEKHDTLPANQLRFHAWYNQKLTEPLKGDENAWSMLRQADKITDNKSNYLIIDAEGRGHYVGMNYYVNSPTPMWYGEGDDMWQIDGEDWPYSLHGTGTEDYFNSSWCPKEVFMHPFFGYPRVNDNIGWLGRTHCYRFHVEDPILFKKSLKGSIEHGHANTLTLSMSSVAYWYQAEPHKPFPDLPGPKARLPRRDINFRDIHKWRDAWRQAQEYETLWGNEKMDDEE